MTRKRRWVLGCLAAVLLIAAGCESTGGSQMQTTVYDTHRRMVKLDRELDSSVSRLNETTATLLARVDESDQQTRMLRGLIEENQVKLDNLSRDLNNMKTTLYRHWNLTTAAPGVAQRDAAAGAVTIEGAPTLTPTPTPAPPLHELMDSAPVPLERTPPAEPTSTPTPPPPTTFEPEITQEPEYESTPPPPSTEAGVGDPRLVYQQAQRSYANDDFATALREFDNYLARFPNEDPSLSANALFWKAKCLMSLERYAESVQAFESLRGAYPTSTKVPFAMHNQAVAHSRLGQTAQAERLMEAVIDQYPISPAADQARADLRKLRGE